MRTMKITFDIGVLLFAAAAFAGSLLASRDTNERDWKAGFGRPETITGTILMVEPSQGVIVLTHSGSETFSPPFTAVQKTTAQRTTVDQESVAETSTGVDYKFTVRSSTPITVDGQRATLADLANMTGGGARIRCVPERSGNYTLSVEVSR